MDVKCLQIMKKKRNFRYFWFLEISLLWMTKSKRNFPETWIRWSILNDMDFFLCNDVVSFVWSKVISKTHVNISPFFLLSVATTLTEIYKHCNVHTSLETTLWMQKKQIKNLQWPTRNHYIISIESVVRNLTRRV